MKKNIEVAAAVAWHQLEKIHPGAVKNVRFEHADESGYWFTYELQNDPRRQTYAVRPWEVNTEC